MGDQQISDSWEWGDPYERYIGRWSRKLAPAFLAWLNCQAGLRWLDVGCGTGALCAAIVSHCSPALVAGVEPSAGFLRTARQHLAGKVVLSQGAATEIPLKHSSVDGLVSGLVLNFVKDSHAALAEMTRVTRNGGTIGAYVWDYAGKMELLRLFWDAAAELDPAAAAKDEGVRFPLCNPTALKSLFSKAGLTKIDVTAVDVQTVFSGFDDYWQPFLGGQGPAPAYVMSLEENARLRLRDHILERLPVQADGSISLVGRAWAIRATVAK